MELKLDTGSFQTALGAIDSLSRFVIGIGDSAQTGTEDVLLQTTDNGEIIVEYAKNGLYVKKYVTGTIIEAGKLVMNLRFIYGIAFRSKEVELKYIAGENRLHFHSGRLKGEVDVHQDFGIIESNKPTDFVKPTFSINIEKLAKCCQLTHFNSHDPMVTGASGTGLPMHMQIKNKRLRVSTNDYMCGAVAQVDLEKDHPDADFVLPFDFVKKVISLTDSETVNIGIGEGSFRLKSEDLDVIHPTQQFNSVDVLQEISDDIKKNAVVITAKLSPKEAAETIHEASSLVINVFPVDAEVFIKFTKGKNKAYIEVPSSHGNATSNFDLQSLDIQSEETKITIKLSCYVISDFLSLLHGDEATIQLTSLLDRIYIHSETDQTDYLLFAIS